MSYQRVIPRDLFNEANLLKCFGQMYLLLETLNLPDVTLWHDDEAFDIDMNMDSGNLVLRNVRLIVRGETVTIERPLNSRYSWPLYLTTKDDEELEVFNNNGTFSDEMLKFLGVN